MLVNNGRKLGRCVAVAAQHLGDVEAAAPGLATDRDDAGAKHNSARAEVGLLLLPAGSLVDSGCEFHYDRPCNGCMGPIVNNEMSPVNRHFYYAENISSRLERMRAAKDMTWSEFAQFIGVSRQYLNLLRIGARQPSRKLDQLLIALEKELLTENGNSALSVRETPDSYDPDATLRKIDLLAAENLGLKATLMALDERLKKLEGAG